MEKPKKMRSAEKGLIWDAKRRGARKKPSLKFKVSGVRNLRECPSEIPPIFQFFRFFFYDIKHLIRGKILAANSRKFFRLNSVLAKCYELGNKVFGA